MKFSFELKTKTCVEKIWGLYSDVNRWFAWEDDLEDISLEGNFERGSFGEMKLSGQPAMKFELISVIRNKEFTDKTSIPDVGDIYFIHELTSENGWTIIRHSVEFMPNNRADSLEDAGFVSQIFSDVPASIFSLIKAAND
ncbi:hypothetical protein LL14B4_03290 [Lactococcus lactis subsp. lactis]|jgi:hypothetical protein|uniref:Polyketide cyclase n=1 Tax=Lactococcus lactis subsp. lactis TaxID=1360 RepID=A0A2Z3KHA7_LACLL|nr:MULTISPECIES: hypothetical protein [Lactococcus]AWN65245.1 hypothetical protein LL14B4_03290 [Lactococcus lactis subsp. lactis]MBK0030634.1 hypothetical protein [Lactococcus sp. S47]